MKRQIPSKLGCLDLPGRTDWSRLTHRPLFLGEVDPAVIDPEAPELQILLSFAWDHDWEYNRCVGLYIHPAAVCLVGSTGTHVDEGLGWLLSWIIQMEPLTFYLKDQDVAAHSADAVELVTAGQSLELTNGDVFLFNASRPHAWISNFNCTLLQVPVKRRRRGASFKPF